MPERDPERDAPVDGSGGPIGDPNDSASGASEPADGPDGDAGGRDGAGNAAADARDDVGTGESDDVSDGETADESDDATTESADQPLPDDVVDEAERLTRLARRVGDPAEAQQYREARAELLAAHDYAALVREDPEGDALVCHPEDWLVDGDVDATRIDDVERAVEVPLEGAHDPEDWDDVYEANHAVADAVREAHGDAHGENAAAFAEYVSNHYGKRLQAVTADELAHFREDYYPRNVWPTDEQAAVLDRSLELVYEELSVPLPEE